MQYRRRVLPLIVFSLNKKGSRFDATETTKRLFRLCSRRREKTKDDVSRFESTLFQEEEEEILRGGTL